MLSDALEPGFAQVIDMRADAERILPGSTLTWLGWGQLRDAHLETHKGDLDLPPHQNLRAVQLLLEHTKLESTVRSLGIEVNDALEMAEQTEV